MEPRMSLATLALLVGLAVLARSSLQAPASDPRIDADRAWALHERVFSDQARPVGSDEAAAARARIAAVLDEVGCAPHEQVAWSCVPGRCALVTNLWCRLSRGDGPAIVGLAHTDSVAAGPGAADDGAGVAAWLEVAHVLRDDPPHRPVVLVLTDGEEAGLLGARALLRDPPFPEPIGAVINLEARGTEGASLLFELSGPTGWLVRAFGQGDARPNGSSVFDAVYERLPNDTDLTVFEEHGVAGANHSFLLGLPRYHTPLDSRDHLDPASVAHHAAVGLAWVQGLDEAPAADPPHDRVAFLDVLGWKLLWWPEAWALPAAALGWLVTAGIVGLDLRQRTRWPSLLAAGGAAVLAVAAAVAVAEALGWLVSAAVGPAWYGRPGPIVAAVWASTSLCALLAGKVGDPVARWDAVWLLLATGGVGVAWVEPMGSVLLLPPVLWAVAARGVALRRPLWGVALGAVGLAAVWLPYAWGLPEALSLQHAGTVAAPLGVALLGALPAVPERIREAAAAVSAALALAVGMAVTGPAFTPSRPQPVNLTYVQGGDSATLHAKALIGTLPPGLSEQVPVPSLELPPPVVEVLGARTWRIRPARSGRVLLLEAPEDSVWVDGEQTAMRGGRLKLIGIGDEGVVVRVAGSRLLVGELTDGLPAELGTYDDLRGDAAVPIHQGDGAIVWRQPHQSRFTP